MNGHRPFKKLIQADDTALGHKIHDITPINLSIDEIDDHSVNENELSEEHQPNIFGLDITEQNSLPSLLQTPSFSQGYSVNSNDFS